MWVVIGRVVFGYKQRSQCLTKIEVKQTTPWGGA